MPARPRPICPSAVVLHVEPTGRVVGPRDLVNALTELGIGVGREAGADALIGRPECSPPPLTQRGAPCGDPKGPAFPVGKVGVNTGPAFAGFPLARGSGFATA